jgi:hypothetical protein
LWYWVVSMDAMELDSIVECYADSEMDQFRIDVSDNCFDYLCGMRNTESISKLPGWEFWGSVVSWLRLATKEAPVSDNSNSNTHSSTVHVLSLEGSSHSASLSFRLNQIQISSYQKFISDVIQRLNLHNFPNLFIRISWKKSIFVSKAPRSNIELHKTSAKRDSFLHFHCKLLTVRLPLSEGLKL